jgi:hypothetical protein
MLHAPFSMHHTNSEYVYFQYWSTFPPGIHPAYFGQIFSATLSVLLPFHWKHYVDRFKVLDLFHIFHGWLPTSVERPTKKVRVNARMRWAVLVLGVFLVMEQIPIYGLRTVEPDYLMWLRPLASSSKGTVTSPLFSEVSHD